MSRPEVKNDKISYMGEKSLKIIKNDLDYKFPAKTGSGYTPPEQPQLPKEHLLHVYLGGRNYYFQTLLNIKNMMVWKQGLLPHILD